MELLICITINNLKTIRLFLTAFLITSAVKEKTGLEAKLLISLEAKIYKASCLILPL